MVVTSEVRSTCVSNLPKVTGYCTGGSWTRSLLITSRVSWVLSTTLLILYWLLYSTDSTDPRTVVCCMAVSMLLPVFCVQFLAVIYSAFLTMEKGKLKKLLIHRHQACRAAFKLLVSSQVPVLNVTPLMFWRHFHNSWPTALHSLSSGSWLAWTDFTTQLSDMVNNGFWC